MKDFLMYGIDGWKTYYQAGTSSVYVIFAFIYLAYIYLTKRKKETVTNVRLAVRISGVLFLTLLCPGTSQFINHLNPTGDASFLYFLVPTAVIMGITGVELYALVEDGIKAKTYHRFAKPGLFVGAALLFLTTLTSPFLISLGHFSVPKNSEKINREVYEIAEVVGDDMVLLPRRYAASMGEISSKIDYVSTTEQQIFDNNVDQIIAGGQDMYADYVVVDKWQLSSDALSNMQATFENNRYTLVKDEKNYAIFKRGDYWVMTQHADVVAQGTFYTFYNKDKDALIVVDGGWDGNTDHVREVINGYGGHVTAWILSHYHLDHAGAFCEIYDDPQGITIDDVYVSNYDSAYYDHFLQNYAPHDNPETFAKYMEVTNGGSAKNIHHPARGEEINIDGLDVKFMNTYDDTLLAMENGDIPNNCGLTFTIRGERDSALFMADTYSPAVGEYMIRKYGEEIQTEYLQLPHHGNSYMPYTFYEAVNPSVVLFDAPENLMQSDEHLAKSLAQWVDENEITRYDFTTAPNSFKFW